ncbi:hypothetical protein G6M26_25780 [Agrobacterium tumefaciens]|nr:hypothetical protein [Agrobacterium tumefaciens]NTE21960.1 hypothetical protein [Agrobacterium tumefaciens]
MKFKSKMLVVFHNTLNISYYDESIINSYVFINVNPKNDLTKLPTCLKVINLYDFNNFISLGKFYAESEVIYNVYRNWESFEDLEYIGFLQHDIDSSPIDSSYLDSIKEYDHINFQPYQFDYDYKQNILMDPSQPDKKTGRGKNCYYKIIEDYNSYYGTNHNIDDLKNKTINLCSSFLIKAKIFLKMMAFISFIIEKGELYMYDSKRENRIQGGLLERYFAVWLAFENLNVVEFGLEHHFAESDIRKTILERITNKVFKLFR